MPEETADPEAQEKAALKEVAALAKSKGLKMRWAADTILVIGTNEHGGKKVSDQQIPVGDRPEGRSGGDGQGECA